MGTIRDLNGLIFMKNVKRYTYYNINDTTLSSRQFMRYEGNFLESYYHVYTVSLNQTNITLRNVRISKKKLISKGPILAQSLIIWWQILQFTFALMDFPPNFLAYYSRRCMSSAFFFFFWPLDILFLVEYFMSRSSHHSRTLRSHSLDDKTFKSGHFLVFIEVSQIV